MNVCAKARKPADYYGVSRYVGDVAKERFYFVSDTPLLQAPVPATVYWGAPGIGKSTLLREDMDKQKLNLIISYDESSSFYAEFAPSHDRFDFPVYPHETVRCAPSRSAEMFYHQSHVDQVDHLLDMALTSTRTAAMAGAGFFRLYIDGAFEKLLYIDNCPFRLGRHMSKFAALLEVSDSVSLTMKGHPNCHENRLATVGWRLVESV